MPTWCFKTADRYTRHTHTRQWYWQISAEDMLSPASMRLFPTIDECVTDAKVHGFEGEIDMPKTLSHPAVITCDQDDYVEGVAQRVLMQRFETHAV